MMPQLNTELLPSFHLLQLSLAHQIVLLAALKVLIESVLKCSRSTESFSVVYNVLTQCQQLKNKTPPVNDLGWVIKQAKSVSNEKETSLNTLQLKYFIY